MDFPEQPEPSSSPGGFTEPTAFEESHVAQVYDFIAPHFSGTRYKPWPQIVAFLQTFQPYAFIADVGCGNGKYEGCNETAVMHGSDLSPELLKFAQQRGMQCIVSTNLNLPYRSQSMVSHSFGQILRLRMDLSRLQSFITLTLLIAESLLFEKWQDY
ncbi:putative S-adenosyl-L-methionine-dependent methyltransferase [Blattamonas nauphoetae]|uniref:S-adenosyl-L-methionine-dependent methyltransferase n=1 Tax=Blattamonas nauphoetae TaxID=2049346 RepID=A0ABQ9X283_9EUKA|nr:putative S-adenosyl-L-methionine-dependent methyltransferase [Blattamonas nauphoetae]